MRRIPAERPLVWRRERRFALKLSRAAFEQRYGPPHATEDRGGGLGPEDMWALHGECGLEAFFLYVQRADRFVVVTEDLEPEHVLAHLEMPYEELEVPPEPARPADGWAVVRQDEHGSRVDVCVLPLRAHAQCLAGRLEAQGHPQLYAVERRGSPRGTGWTRRGWVVVKECTPGQREEVAVHPNEQMARQLTLLYSQGLGEGGRCFIEPGEPAELEVP